MADEKKFPDDPKSDPKPADKKEPKDAPEDKAEKDAVQAETKGAKSDAADLSDLKQIIAALQPLLDKMPQLMQLVALMDEEGGPVDEDQDLMRPAGGPKPPLDDKSAPKPAEKDKDAVVEDGKVSQHVKFESSMGSATNGFTPSFTKKEDYKVTDQEKVKYKAEVEAEVAAKYKAELEAVKKVASDLNKKSRLQEAEKLIYSLEKDFNIVFSTPEAKAEDTQMLAELEPKSAAVMFERMKVRYQKRLPDSKGVEEVAKYAIEGEPDLSPKTAEEAQERAIKIRQSGLSVEEFYKKLTEGKTKK
jgi:hypothetical protein